MTALERPKSLTELVADELRDWIIQGRVDFGELMSESRISRELKVSRTPVREALNRLESEGLVRTLPQRGTFVFSLGPNELAKICDVRVCLENMALLTAFEQNRSNLLERLGACTDRMKTARAAGDDQAYLSEDTHFHAILVECAQNRFLEDAYLTISAKMAALRNRLGGHPEHMSKSFNEHLAIVDALSKGDLDLAVELLERHIGRKEGSYWTMASSRAQVETG